MTPGPPYWPGEPDRTLRAVGPEFFGTVLTQRVLAYACSFGFSRADCIAYLRGQMAIEPYWYGTDDFYLLNSGAVAEDYESLMRIANSELAESSYGARTVLSGSFTGALLAESARV